MLATSQVRFVHRFDGFLKAIFHLRKIFILVLLLVWSFLQQMIQNLSNFELDSFDFDG
jgi:preprotein translocase subunit Sec63